MVRCKNSQELTEIKVAHLSIDGSCAHFHRGLDASGGSDVKESSSSRASA